MKKYKYQYWHLITKSFDKRFPKGEFLSNNQKMNYKGYEIFNMKTGKSKIVCHVEYVCRTLTDLSTEEKIKILKEKSSPSTPKQKVRKTRPTIKWHGKKNQLIGHKISNTFLQKKN